MGPRTLVVAPRPLSSQEAAVSPDEQPPEEVRWTFWEAWIGSIVIANRTWTGCRCRMAAGPGGPEGLPRVSGCDPIFVF